MTAKQGEAMKTFKIAALATAVLSTITIFNPASAVTFGQKEIEQSKIIAIAIPGSTFPKLYVIEQISNARPCWSESGSNPIIVDPLFSTFDFTGICGRAMDSNGYSIRMANQDLGLQYNLRLVQKENDIVLIGYSFQPNAPQIEIGRTYGISNEPMKIILNPGWRFTKRTYEGKTLGHTYFTNDLPLSSITSGGGSTINGNTGSSTFKDIAGDIYAKEIEQAVSLGFVAGFADNTFQPQGTLTREQLVSLVVESLKKIPNVNITIPTQVTSRPYPDVEPSRWSAAKIQFARDNNLIKGYEDGTFRPTKAVTRAEMITILRKAAEFSKTLRGLPPQLNANLPVKAFSDIKKHWAASTIEQMSSFCAVASPLNETGDQFYPDEAARRNYAVAATLRMINCVKEEKPTASS